MAINFLANQTIDNTIKFVGGGENYATLKMVSQGLEVSVGDPANTTNPLVHFDGAYERVLIGSTTAANTPYLRIGGAGNQSSILELAETTTGVGKDMNYGFSFNQTGNVSNTLEIKRHSNSTAGSTVMTLARDNNNVVFTGLVSGITPTSAANFVTKAYADGLTPGSGIYLPINNPTFTGTLTGPTANFTSTVTVDNMLTININDISTGENRGLRLINEAGTDQQWNITAGTTGITNDDFCIRDSTNNVNAFRLSEVTGNATFAGQVTATEYNLPSGGVLDWANGDARIIEGLVNNYSLSFQTWDGTNLNTALRLDGNNNATFTGNVLATNVYVDTKIIHNGDANTYIQFADTNDKIILATNGSDALTIDASQAATFTGNVIVQGTSAAGYVKLSGDGNGAIYTSNGDMQFFTNNSAYATKFYSANKGSTLVTILDNGTTTFAGNVNTGRLFVEQSGADIIDMTRTGVGTYRFAISGSDAFSLFDVGANADRLTIDTSGNATFTGDVTLTGTGDKILDIYRDGGSGHSIRLHSEGVSWIDNNNNFGIGTDSPTAKLTIDNSIATTYSASGYAATPANSMLYLNNTQGGSNTASLINFRTGSGDGVMGFVEGGGTNDADFIIQTDGGSNGLERLRILNNGNVGIGTTAPAARLHVKEPSGSTSQIKMSAASDEANYGYLTMTDNTANTAKLTFGTTYGYNTSVDAMTIFNGNVGIGTNSPSELLHLKSGAGASTDIGLEESGIGWRLRNDQSANSFMLSSVTGTFDTFVNRFVVKQDGNIGIGTDSPDYKLQVNAGSNIASFKSTGSGENEKELLISSGGDRTILSSKNTDGTGADLAFSTGSFESMRIDSDGNVGIGTNNPTAMLHIRKDDATVYDPSADDGQRGVGATIQLNNNSTTTNTFGQIMYDTDSSNQAVARIVFLDAGNASSAMAFVTENGEQKGERMRIAADGNVGIGTPSPTRRLEISESGNGNSKEAIFRSIGTNTLGSGSSVSEIVTRQVTGGGAQESAMDIRVRAIGDLFPSPSTVMTIEGGGNVGIGETAPTEKFVVNGSVNSINQSVNFATGPYRATMDIISSIKLVRIGSVKGAVTPTGDEGEVAFFVNSVEKARIDKDGNFGIGVTNPGATLDVSGSFRLQSGGSTYLSIGSSSGSPYINTGTSGGTVQFGAPASNTTNIQVQGTVRATGGYKSADGTAGITGTFTFVDKASATRSLTIKNGLITAKT